MGVVRTLMSVPMSSMALSHIVMLAILWTAGALPSSLGLPTPGWQVCSELPLNATTNDTGYFQVTNATASLVTQSFVIYTMDGTLERTIAWGTMASNLYWWRDGSWVKGPFQDMSLLCQDNQCPIQKSDA